MAFRFRPLPAVLLALAVSAPEARQQAASLSADETSIVRGITAAALKDDVTFLASDALEGRDTPSAGLDRAAEYIASRFRDLRLEAAGDSGYFQMAPFETVTQSSDGLSLSVTTAGQSVSVPKEKLVWLSTSRLDVKRADLYLLDRDHLPPAAETRGKVVLVDLADVQSWTPDQKTSRARLLGDPTEPKSALAQLEPAAILFNRAKTDNFGGVQLREASAERPARNSAAVVSVNDERFRALVAGWTPARVAASIDLSVPAPVVQAVRLKNVVGVIRGANPQLRDSCVVVSAHYDHLGVRPTGEGDRIANGANDNASGVAAMLDIARAIAASPVKPRRSILFVAYFGEEKGLLGSEWYAKHPIFPFAKTVANLNLEQLGRTDDPDGPQVARAAATGFDYSEVGEMLARAGAGVGVTFYKHPKYNDQAFARSDNLPLAKAGVPAHTVGVTFTFPGRHTPADEADKLDYPNMELVTRGLAVAVWRLATDDHAPEWTSTNPNAAPYANVRNPAPARGHGELRRPLDRL